MICTECNTAWCFLCNTKVPSPISLGYKHFYLPGYNDIVPGLCALHDTENLTGYNCEECDRVLNCMDNETDGFYDDGNDYLCDLCESKFEWPCEAANHVKEHSNGKTLVIMKFTVSSKYDTQNEEENVNNAKNIHNKISQLTNVFGVSNIWGNDKFLTPPWFFQIILKHKDVTEQFPTEDFFPKFIVSVDNITEEYGTLGKRFRGGIPIWKSDTALLLVESPKVKEFPVKQWLSDPCHAPQFKIVNQSVNCQKCQQVIQDVPDILNNRMKEEESILTLYECRRYKRYYCGCKAGTSLTGNPLAKYHENGEYHKYWPHGHSGKRCDLKFVHACDLWKHNKDHNSGYEGRGLVRLCLPATATDDKDDKTLLENTRKLLNADSNVLIVDPQYDNIDYPVDYWEQGKCIDVIVKENFHPEKYFHENKELFVPKERAYYLKYFPLGDYICKAMIFYCLKRKCLLYENFHKNKKVPEEVVSVESGTIRKHLIRTCLRKIKTAQKNGLWKFEEMNRQYRLIGGSLPKISIHEIESEESNHSPVEFSDDEEMSSDVEDSSGSS